MICTPQLPSFSLGRHLPVSCISFQIWVFEHIILSSFFVFLHKWQHTNLWKSYVGCFFPPRTIVLTLCKHLCLHSFQRLHSCMLDVRCMLNVKDRDSYTKAWELLSKLFLVTQFLFLVISVTIAKQPTISDFPAQACPGLTIIGGTIESCIF